MNKYAKQASDIKAIYHKKPHPFFEKKSWYSILKIIKDLKQYIYFPVHIQQQRYMDKSIGMPLQQKCI